MTKPVHDLGHAFHPQTVRQLRPLDHDHRQAKLARRVDLGARACASGITGDDPFDTPRTHHVQFADECERPTRNDETCIRQRQRTFCGIDESKRVGVLRPRGERRDVLPPDGQKHARRFDRQCRNSRRDVGNLDPDIARRFRPWLAFQRDQRRCRCRAGGHCVAADLGCEGVGRIDHMREALLPNGIGKTVGAAEATNTGRQWLIDRHLRPSGIGIDRVKSRGRGCGRQQIRFARSAQDEDAHE